MSKRFEILVTIILVVCALTTTSLVVYKFAIQADKSEASVPTRLPDWQAIKAQGSIIGPPSAKIDIIEFVDFQCPYCAATHAEYESARRGLRNNVSLTVIHLPLEMHRFAVPSAQAAECARDQGRLEPMIQTLFDSQQQFGSVSWSRLAEQSGVGDLVRFDRCMSDNRIVERIRRNAALAERLNIRATPTLAINGWKIPPLARGQLGALLRNLDNGQEVSEAFENSRTK